MKGLALGPQPAPFLILPLEAVHRRWRRSWEAGQTVDCIVRKNTPYRRTEFERRQRIRIEDFSTWIVSKEDLIISKLWWAKDSRSELQLRDVRNVAGTGGDTDYIEHWTRELGLHSLWLEWKR